MHELFHHREHEKCPGRLPFKLSRSAAILCLYDRAQEESNITYTMRKMRPDTENDYVSATTALRRISQHDYLGMPDSKPCALNTGAD